MEETANKLHLCSDFHSSTRVTVHAKCIYVLTEYLHFVWVVDDAKCIVVTRVCVCVCVCVCLRPYAHTIARTRM